MPTVKREGKPDFWVTRIAKVLVGEQPCYLEPWLSGHYQIEKRPRQDSGSLANWKADHTALLQQTIGTLQTQGWECDVERFVKVTGTYAILTGKVDVIARQKDRRPLIVDAKSGSPKDSDVAQVLIEMVALPLAWNAPQMIFDGCVVYKTHKVKVEPAQAAELKPKLFALLKRLGTMERPEPNPGEHTCRYCDVNETDCPKRFSAADVVPTAVTAEF
jgi:RecB family exonuclease